MESLTIVSSSIVFPSLPTPNGRLPLSENDQMMGWIPFPLIYVYKPSDSDASFSIDSFKNSLSNVLVPYYPMAGRLHWLAGSRLELHCCAAGALLIEASTHSKLDDYGDFAPTDAVRQQFVPTVDHSAPIEEMPVFMVQVTRFSCGGLVIGVCFPHTLVDGFSVLPFINSWASIARGEKTMESILQPFHDRTKVLQPQKPLHPPSFHHREFDIPPFLLGRSDADEERKKESQVALLRVTKQQVEKLKKRANETIDKQLQPRPRPHSRYESLAGHMWVCACKARSTGESSQPTVALVAVDTRRRRRTPLPEGFFGNATMMTVTPICELGDLITKPLSYAAGKIREATWKFTEEYVESAMRFLASQEEMGWVRKWYMSSGSGKEAPFWGNPNLYLGPWMTLPFYEADFGWGRPCYVGPARMKVDGETFLMPGPAGDGSLIIAIRLQTEHMDEFKKLFYEDISMSKL